jgi:hypothetical protein
VQPGAVLAREDQPCRVGVGAPRRPLPLLDVPPAPQDADGGLVDGDGAFAVLGLGVPDLGLPAELDDLLGDPYGAGPEVDVLPSQTDGLTAAECAVGDEMEQRVEPVLGRSVEEAAGLLGGPDGHRRSFRPALPAEDPVRGPHHRPRASAARDLDVARGIGGDVFAAYRGVQCRQQGGVDPTDRGGRQDPGGGRLPARGLESDEGVGRLSVARGPELTHCGVKRFDVGLAELGELVVAEGRREVEPDVFAASAIRRSGDPAIRRSGDPAIRRSGGRRPRWPRCRRSGAVGSSARPC